MMHDVMQHMTRHIAYMYTYLLPCGRVWDYVRFAPHKDPSGVSLDATSPRESSQWLLFLPHPSFLSLEHDRQTDRHQDTGTSVLLTSFNEVTLFPILKYYMSYGA